MPELSKGSILGVVTLQCMAILTMLAVVLFLSAWKINWIGAWIFLGVYGICYWITTYLLFTMVPELMEERKKKKEGVPKTDKVLVFLYQTMYFPVFVIAGLDERYQWTTMNLSTSLLFLIPVIAAFVIMTWAPLSNPYLETYIRIQTEKGHHVCDKGPYSCIRHPAYLGLILFFTGIPLALGSLWALIPGIIASTLVIVRTVFEDNFLLNELSGYDKYSRKVKYRLIPGIW